jgi:hypothetical protein
MSDPNTKADPSASYQLLRRETAEMLRINADDLGLVDGLQLDITSLLRLVIDSLQGKVLVGEEVDLGKLQVAHALLRQMLPPAAMVAPAPAPETARRFGTDHRARLRQLIENVVLREDETKAAALADAQAREEQTMADEAAGKPPEEHRPLRETLAPAPEIVPFPSKNIATGQQPHLKAASAAPSAVSEPAPRGPVPRPLGRPEGYRVGPPTEPWRGYLSYYL